MANNLPVAQGELLGGMKTMKRRRWVFPAGVTCLLILFPVVGCWRESPSAIVRMVENSGAGDVRTASVASIVQWFRRHPAVALKTDDLCRPVQKSALAKWPETTEGIVCAAASEVAGFIVWQRTIKGKNDHETFQRGSR